jgi:hypothetical protein
VTVKVIVPPRIALFSAGKIDTLTLLDVARTTQLSLSFIVPFPWDTAVTVILSSELTNALSGMVTLNVAFLLLDGETESDVGEMLGDHPALSVTVKE